MIVTYLKKLNIENTKKYEKKKKILASEVSGKQIQKTNVDTIKDQIKALEQDAQTDPTKAKVKELLDSSFK